MFFFSISIYKQHSIYEQSGTQHGERKFAPVPSHVLGVRSSLFQLAIPCLPSLFHCLLNFRLVSS